MKLNNKINHKIISIGKRSKGHFYSKHLGKCSTFLNDLEKAINWHIYLLASKKDLTPIDGRYENIVLPAIDRLHNYDLSIFNEELEELIKLRQNILNVNYLFKNRHIDYLKEKKPKFNFLKK